MENWTEKIRKILKEIRSQRRWRIILTTMAGAVVFVTTYALILPGITLEEEVALEDPGIFLEGDVAEEAFEEELFAEDAEAGLPADGADAFLLEGDELFAEDQEPDGFAGVDAQGDWTALDTLEEYDAVDGGDGLALDDVAGAADGALTDGFLIEDAEAFKTEDELSTDHFRILMDEAAMVPEGTTISVKEIQDVQIYQETAAILLGADVDAMKVYEIRLEKDGQQILPMSEVTVETSIEAAITADAVLAFSDPSYAQLYEAEVQDNKLVFATDEITYLAFCSLGDAAVLIDGVDAEIAADAADAEIEADAAYAEFIPEGEIVENVPDISDVEIITDAADTEIVTDITDAEIAADEEYIDSTVVLEESADHSGEALEAIEEITVIEEPVSEAEPVVEAESVSEAEPVVEAEPIPEAEPVVEAEPVSEAALISEEEQTITIGELVGVAQMIQTEARETEVPAEIEQSIPMGISMELNLDGTDGTIAAVRTETMAEEETEAVATEAQTEETAVVEEIGETLAEEETEDLFIKLPKGETEETFEEEALEENITEVETEVLLPEEETKERLAEEMEEDLTESETEEGLLEGETEVPSDNSVRKLSKKEETYEVEVLYGAEAGIPDGAELEVTEIRQEDHTETAETEEGTEVTGPNYEQCLEKSREYVEEGSAITYARFFSIRILYEGTEITPEAPVTVNIYLSDVKDDVELNTVHLTEDNAEVIGTNTQEGISFETSGF